MTRRCDVFARLSFPSFCPRDAATPRPALISCKWHSSGSARNIVARRALERQGAATVRSI
eukprot:1743578-Pyramimonas_sp.AAC.1